MGYASNMVYIQAEHPWQLETSLGTEVGMTFHFVRMHLSIFTMENIMGDEKEGS